MKKTMRRAIAVTTAGAAGLAGAIAFQVPAATAAEGDAAASAPAARLSNLGMGGWSYGTRFLVDGIELRSQKYAFSEMPCTRIVNNKGVSQTLTEDVTFGAIPQELQDIVDLGILQTSNRTYETAERVGSLATSTLGYVKIGGPNDLGLPIPELKIEGLQSTADAFRTKDGKFGTDEDVTIKGISLDIPRDNLPPELEPVLNVLDQIEAGITPVQEGITDVLGQILEATEGPLSGLPIPGLGALTLRQQKSTVTGNGAVSESWALGILLDPDGPEGTQFAPTEIKLGRAYARIGGGVFGGVFRSWGRAFNLSLLPGGNPNGTGLVDLEIPTKSLPCEGTDGKTVTTAPQQTGAIVGGLLFDLKDVTFSMSGEQHKSGFINKFGRRTNKGWAEGTMAVNIGNLAIPSLQVVLNDVLTSVSVDNRKEGVVKRDLDMSLGSMSVEGRTVTPREEGGTVTEPLSSGGSISLTSAIRDLRLPHGARIAPYVLNILNQDLSDILELNFGESMVFIKKEKLS